MLEIAMLHDVLTASDDEQGPFPSAVSQAQLRQYLEARAHWQNWGGDELKRWLKAGRPPIGKPTFILTFDDAYSSVVTHVVPLLEQYRVKALVFVATRCAEGWETTEARLWRVLVPGTDLRDTPWQHLPLANSEDRLAAYESIRLQLKPMHPYRAADLLDPLLRQHEQPASLHMSWDELIELRNHPCLEFGSHTHEHVFLPTAGLRETQRQLRQSRITLEQRLGMPIRWLSYPYGAVSVRVLVQAWAAGYCGGFMARPGRIRSKFPLSHFMLPRSDIDLLLEQMEGAGTA